MKKRQNNYRKNNQWRICHRFARFVAFTMNVKYLSQIVVLLLFSLYGVDALAKQESLLMEHSEQKTNTVKRYVDAKGYRYRGLIDARVIEPDTAQYIIGAKFKSRYSKPLEFIFRPYNGKANLQAYQPLYEANNGVDKRAFNITHKYYISLRIREDSHDRFRAMIKLFQRRSDLSVDINKPYRFRAKDFKVLSEQLIDGEFDQVNEYLFIDRVDLKFYVKLDFDIIFTAKEIMERFEQ